MVNPRLKLCAATLMVSTPASLRTALDMQANSAVDGDAVRSDASERLWKSQRPNSVRP